MGGDWNEPRDRGPDVEERKKPQKKRGGKKPFVIESRYHGPMSLGWQLNQEWQTYGRYKTTKAQDEALNTLQHKSRTHYRMDCEYRKKP